MFFFPSFADIGTAKRREEVKLFQDKFLWRELTLLLIVEVEFSAEFIMKFKIQNFVSSFNTKRGPCEKRQVASR